MEYYLDTTISFRDPREALRESLREQNRNLMRLAEALGGLSDSLGKMSSANKKLGTALGELSGAASDATRNVKKLR